MHMKHLAIFAALTMSGAAIAADQPAIGHSGWDRAAMEQMRAKREARRVDDMAVLLGLRADQRPALDRFLQSMKPPRGMPGDKRDAGMSRPSSDDMTLPARLDAMQAQTDARAAMMKQGLEAARQFYAGLTPDQQRRFDALDDLRRDRGHGHHGGMGGFHRGMHGPSGVAAG